MSRRVSRRRFLGTAGLAGAGLALMAGTAALEPATRPARAAAGGVVPFHGAHQAGIVTPAQERLFIATFDLLTDDVAQVRALLRDWTAAAERMTAGEPVGAVDGSPVVPPPDTGEAVGLSAGNLTVTVGFGPGFFERLGLADRRPAALVDLPSFAGDTLDPARSGGDLVVQACGDDPQVTFHAVRNLARIARGVAVMRWSQFGFGRTASTSRAQETPRNLMGFKDGTNNLHLEDADLLAEHLWSAASDGAGWMAGGTYLVARRVRILIEVWDRSSLADQEASIGRHKISGAPIGSRDEFTPVDLAATNEDGELLIPDQSHVRLASPETNAGARMLRRGYSYTDGMDPLTGQLDAGLFFIAFMRDPRTAFIPVQRQLATDLLNEYIRHTGSGIFAIPPGVEQGGYLGQTLLEG